MSKVRLNYLKYWQINRFMKKKSNIVILAAGTSSRMGTPKFLLEYDENTTFLEQIIKGYEAFGCKRIIVVLNEDNARLLRQNYLPYLSDKIEIVVNRHLNWERFYSVKLALAKLNSNSPVFIHNVDNPFVNQSILQLLLENISENNFVVPEFQGSRGHPILLSEKIVKGIVFEEKNNSNLKNFLKIYKKLVVEVNDDKILVNINSKEDYDVFRTLKNR